MKRLMDAIGVVLAQKIYFAIFLVASIMLFVLLYFLSVATVAGYSLGIYVVMNGFWYTVLTLILSIAIALFFGLYVSLLICKIKTAKKSGLSGFFGIVAGILSAGCPTCGSLVLGIFGAPLGLLFLPFKGIELKILSLILLAASVFLIAKNLNSCDI